MDEIIRTVSITFSFSEHIDKIWEVIKRGDLVATINTNYFSCFELIKGKNSYELGNQFKFCWKNQKFIIAEVNLR